jgi:hypothetical protein
MRSDEFNILIEYMNFVNKFGEKKIEKLLSILKDTEQLNILICSLEEAKKLAKKEYIESKQYIISDKNMLHFNQVFKLLMDKSKFKNNNQLLHFFNNYHFNSNRSKREEKVRDFLCFVDRTLNISFDILYEDILKFHNYMLNEQDVNQNDLANWSSLIVRKKDAIEIK